MYLKKSNRGIFSGCVQSSMLHGIETWPLRKENEVALQQAEIICDTCLCLVLVCCWCHTATSGSDLDWLLLNSLSLTCVWHCDV